MLCVAFTLGATTACLHRRLHHTAASYERHSHCRLDVEFRIHSSHAHHSLRMEMVERRASHELMAYDERRE